MSRYAILYVDDEAINVMNFRIMYQKEYTVFTAKNGVEALDIISKNNVNIIFTDQKMPEMSGVELCEKVLESGRQIACYIITGYLDDEEVSSAIEREIAKGKVTKPIRFFMINEILAKELAG